MTGFGDARVVNEPLELRVELRAVNNRYFKLTSRLPDLYSSFESRIEKLIRQTISRGTVSLNLARVHTENQLATSFNRTAIEAYLDQWDRLREQLTQLPVLSAGDLLQLEGVVAESSEPLTDFESEWTFVEQGIQQALRKFDEFRIEEGRLMSADLSAQIETISAQLQTVSRRAPEIVHQYRDRMVDRVADLLKVHDLAVDASDLIREVSVFADRCDVNEEIIRLLAHLGQFSTFLASDASEGKRLDFLSQEMNREINTIGSKANDVEIAHCVVEMKAAVEKIREVLQNVE